MKFISIFFLAVIASFNLHAAEVCIDPASDPDGDGWGFEQEASCFVVISGTGANGELLSPAAVKSQSVFHPRTAEKINIQRIYWTAADFADKSFTGCNGYVVDPAQANDQCESCESAESSRYEHYADGNGRLFYQNGAVNFEAEFFWSVDQLGLYYGPMPVLAYAEITETGINQWLEGTPGAIGFYEHCAGLVPSSDQVGGVITVSDGGGGGNSGNGDNNNDSGNNNGNDSGSNNSNDSGSNNSNDSGNNNSNDSGNNNSDDSGNNNSNDSGSTNSNDSGSNNSNDSGSNNSNDSGSNNSNDSGSNNSNDSDSNNSNDSGSNNSTDSGSDNNNDSGNDSNGNDSDNNNAVITPAL